MQTLQTTFKARPWGQRGCSGCGAWAGADAARVPTRLPLWGQLISPMACGAVSLERCVSKGAQVRAQSISSPAEPSRPFTHGAAVCFAVSCSPWPGAWRLGGEWVPVMADEEQGQREFAAVTHGSVCSSPRWGICCVALAEVFTDSSAARQSLQGHWAKGKQKPW